MGKGKVVSLEERIPKLKQQRKQKTNRRITTYLSIFFVLILAVIYFQSPLSRISAIKVIGNQYITSDKIIQFSKLAVGTGIWNMNANEVKKNIQGHPEIKAAIVEKKFPNIVVIKVRENQRIALLQQNNGNLLPILENGNVLKSSNYEKTLLNAPVFVNWTKKEDIQEMVAQLIQLPKSIVNDISEIDYTPVPTDSKQITLYMNDGNEVKATIQNFSDKMQYYPSMVKELDPNVKGIFYIDVENRFTPFGVDGNEGEG